DQGGEVGAEVAGRDRRRIGRHNVESGDEPGETVVLTRPYQRSQPRAGVRGGGVGGARSRPARQTMCGIATSTSVVVRHERTTGDVPSGGSSATSPCGVA